MVEFDDKVINKNEVRLVNVRQMLEVVFTKGEDGKLRVEIDGTAQGMHIMSQNVCNADEVTMLKNFFGGF